MDWKTISIPIFVGLILAAIKWLISDWYNKSKELEAEKQKHTTSALNRLENEVTSFRSVVSNLRTEIESLKTVSAVTKSEMKLMQEQLKDVVKKIDQYSRDFDSKIANTIKTELVNLGKQATLYRNKKNG